jgi:hypothetical protein
MMGILQGRMADDGEAFFAVPIASLKERTQQKVTRRD